MNKPAFLRSFVVKGDYIEVTVGENLDLNPLRMSIFKTHIRHYIGTQQEQRNSTLTTKNGSKMPFPA
ncbi:hypothetical protein MRX96_020096 [Rhipicephalus microplus]